MLYKELKKLCKELQRSPSKKILLRHTQTGEVVRLVGRSRTFTEGVVVSGNRIFGVNFLEVCNNGNSIRNQRIQKGRSQEGG